MCGICGIVGPKATEETVAAMRVGLQHRGPDDQGLFFAPGLGLGHARLSILDVSTRGRQPMSSADGNLLIVFNGEIYNYLELKQELGDYPFATETDTEVILAAYERWGTDCLRRFNGMFAFALYDKKKEILFCARDRLGVKPFYYYADGDNFFFASEIKALLKAGVPRRPNNKIICDFLAQGYYDHTTETFFRDIVSLAAGSYALVKPGDIQTFVYWDVPVAEAAITLEEAEQQLKRLLADAVRLRLRSDVPVGVHLSAGLDSSAIVSLANRDLRGTQQLNTFSMGFEEQEFDEGQKIKELIPLLDCQPHFSYLRCAEAVEAVPAAVRSQDQPFAGVPTLAYMKMDALVRKTGVVVVLEGQGGDELFGGYDYYVGAHIIDCLCRFRWLEIARTVARHVRRRGWRSALTFLWRAIESVWRPMGQDATKNTNRSCINPQFLRLHHRRLRGLRKFKSFLKNAQYRDLRFTKLPKILRLNDHASMHSGVEVRFPFLDYRLVEFAFSLPARFKIHQGTQKYLLRRVMDDILPKAIRERPKIAVQTPQQDWIKGCMRDSIQTIISSPQFAQRGIFDVAKAQQAFTDYCRSRERHNSFFIWQWVSLELWFREYIDPPTFV